MKMEAQTEQLCQVKTGRGGRLSFLIASAAGTQLAEALTKALTSKSLPDPHQQLPALVTRLRSPATPGARGVDLSEGDVFMILKHKEALDNLGRAAQGALHSAEAALTQRSSKKTSLAGHTKVFLRPPTTSSGTDGAS